MSTAAYERALLANALRHQRKRPTYRGFFDFLKKKPAASTDAADHPFNVALSIQDPAERAAYIEATGQAQYEAEQKAQRRQQGMETASGIIDAITKGLLPYIGPKQDIPPPTAIEVPAAKGPNWPVIAGVGVGVLLVGGLVFALARR